jgi:hypothetical protein
MLRLIRQAVHEAENVSIDMLSNDVDRLNSTVDNVTTLVTIMSNTKMIK